MSDVASKKGDTVTISEEQEILEKSLQDSRWTKEIRLAPIVELFGEELANAVWNLIIDNGDLKEFTDTVVAVEYNSTGSLEDIRRARFIYAWAMLRLTRRQTWHQIARAMQV